jgi:hypothetical protein
VTVSAQSHFRDRVRSVAEKLTNQQVDYHEFDFQPAISRGFWSRKKPQVDYEGVIRGKENCPSEDKEKGLEIAEEANLLRAGRVSVALRKFVRSYIRTLEHSHTSAGQGPAIRTSQALD